MNSAIRMNLLWMCLVLFSMLPIFILDNLCFAQEDGVEQEEEIDLDELIEDESEEGDASADSQEEFLPVNSEPVMVEPQPATMLTAILLLLPVTFMMIPIKRSSKNKRSNAASTKK